MYEESNVRNINMQKHNNIETYYMLLAKITTKQMTTKGQAINKIT